MFYTNEKQEYIKVISLVFMFYLQSVCVCVYKYIYVCGIYVCAWVCDGRGKKTMLVGQCPALALSSFEPGSLTEPQVLCLFVFWLGWLASCLHSLQCWVQVHGYTQILHRCWGSMCPNYSYTMSHLLSHHFCLLNLHILCNYIRNKF